jgi:hypothetical protein
MRRAQPVHERLQPTFLSRLIRFYQQYVDARDKRGLRESTAGGRFVRALLSSDSISITNEEAP